MEITNSTTADLETIFDLYDAAIAHQKAVSNQHWLPFDRQLVADEIAEGRQWKIVVDGQIACIFLTAYSDPAIWGEKDLDPSIYLHRIVTNPAFRGRNFVQKVVKWSKNQARTSGKKFIRLDTWSDNPRLKELYLQCGFQFLGNQTPANPAALPIHYSTITLGMYELAVD
jgi:ribosomal protein S18 acetylase RimI-like enzyme